MFNVRPYKRVNMPSSRGKVRSVIASTRDARLYTISLPLIILSCFNYPRRMYVSILLHSVGPLVLYC